MTGRESSHAQEADYEIEDCLGVESGDVGLLIDCLRDEYGITPAVIAAATPVGTVATGENPNFRWYDAVPY